MRELHLLTSSDFDPHVGDNFELEVGADASLALELIAVDPLSSGTVENATRAPFSLTFRSPGEWRHVQQQIRTVRHTDLGQMDLFLVPIGPDEVGMRYEAVFT